MTELKIKNYQLPPAMTVLSQLAQEKKIPAKLRWQAVRLKGAIQSLLEDLGKAEGDLVREYAVISPEGELLPGRDQNGEVRQGTWTFRDPTEAFVPTEELKEEPLEALTARRALMNETIKAFQVLHKELMAIENNVLGTQFPVDDFELSELSGEQLDVIGFLILP